MRGYITGSTDTSLWTHYARGERNYCGLAMPDGLVKNQKVVPSSMAEPQPVLLRCTRRRTRVPLQLSRRLLIAHVHVRAEPAAVPCAGGGVRDACIGSPCAMCGADGRAALAKLGHADNQGCRARRADLPRGEGIVH